MVARKTSTTPTKIYSYGCLRPDKATEDLIFSQLRQQTEYRNTLVAIENKRRTDFRQLRSQLCPELIRIEAELAPLTAEFEELRLQLALVKRKERKGHPLSEKRAQVVKKMKALSDPLKAARAAFGELFKATDAVCAAEIKAKSAGRGPHGIREVKAAVLGRMLAEPQWPQAWKDKTLIDMQAHAASVHARSNSKLFCGNYSFVEQAFAQSKKDAQTDPERTHFTGRGRIGIQLQGGISSSEAMSGQDPRFQLVATTPSTKGCYRRKGGVTGFVALRLGTGRPSAATRDLEGPQGPSIIKLPILVHRPLPSDGRIMWAWIKVDKIGLRARYSLQLMLESESFAVATPVGTGVAAMNLGWRKLPNGNVRVGCLWDGVIGRSLELPAKLLGREGLIRELKGAADICFNQARDTLKTRLELTPDWLREMCETLPHWRAHGKLARVSRRLSNEVLGDKLLGQIFWGTWRDQQLGGPEVRRLRIKNNRANRRNDLPITEAPGDLFGPAEELFDFAKKQGLDSELQQLAFYLYAWLEKDAHLINWALHLQKKTERHRKQTFGLWAIEIGKTYEKIVVEDWDKRETAKNPRGHLDTRTEQQVAANAVRQQVGASALIMALKRVMGSRVVEQNAKDITLVHFHCGKTSPDDKIIQIPLLCETCSGYFDQDLNAAQHLRHRYLHPGAAPAEDVQILNIAAE